MNEKLRDASKELTSNVGEVVIDSLLKEGVLKDIPFLGTVFKILDFGKGIRDHLFMRKLVSFCDEATKSGNPISNGKFLESMRADPEMQQKVGDTLVLMLDRFNDMEKPELLAKIYLEFVEAKIDFSQFRRLAIAIEIAFIDDLKVLPQTAGHVHNSDDRFLAMLAPSGLAQTHINRSREGTGAVCMELSPLGWMLRRIMTNQAAAVNRDDGRPSE